MRGLNIGCDVDDVLIDFVPGFAAFHNRSYGTSLAKNDFHSHYYEDVIGISRQEIIGRVYEFYKSAEFQGLARVAGAIEALKTIEGENHQIYVITARPKWHTRITTLKCLDALFEGVSFKKVIFTCDELERPKYSKAQVAKCLGLHAMIDDSLENALLCAEENGKSMKTLLFSQPWNKPSGNGHKEPYFRVEDWHQALQHLL